MRDVVNQRPERRARGGGVKPLPAASWANATPARNPVAMHSTYPSTPQSWPAMKTLGAARRRRSALSSLGALRYVLRWICPKRRNSARSSPGNLPQDARLLGKLEVVLEPHQVVAGRTQVFRPQLHHGIWLPAAARVEQPDGLHGAEAKRVVPSPRQFFDGQAGFEVIQVFEFVRFDRLRASQCFIEVAIFRFIQRAVQIILAIPFPYREAGKTRSGSPFRHPRWD